MQIGAIYFIIFRFHEATVKAARKGGLSLAVSGSKSSGWDRHRSKEEAIMLTLLGVLALLLIAASFGMAIYRMYRYFAERGRFEDGRPYRAEGGEQAQPLARPTLTPHLIGVFVGISALIGLTGSAEVAPTHVAVIENAWTGQFHSLGSGTHIWPFEPRLIPLVTRVTQYNLRQQIIEIGKPPSGAKPPEKKTLTQVYGVQAGSKSPGQPAVYFHARGWAAPNPAKIVDLHRRYGPDYLHNWVEQQWVATLKAVQGENKYDHVRDFRVKMQEEVEKSLQEHMLAADGEHLVVVSQLAIVDYDYDEKVNDYLDTVARQEFERQKAEQQIQINTKQQEAKTVEVQTNYIVTKRNAEAEQAKRIAEAQGQSDAQKLIADGEAYQIFVRAKAEADGVRLVQTVLATAPREYIDYLNVRQWKGDVPSVMMSGNGALPLVNVPLGERKK